MILMSVSAPADFRFRATVESHGWYQLAPFSYDSDSGVLSRRLQLIGGGIVTLNLRESRAKVILIEIKGQEVLTSLQRNQIEQSVRTIFNLEQNLVPFYEKMRKHPDYQWVDTHKAGRLLASPTVWEDLVKTLLTTNTSWSNTRDMVSRLVAIDPAHTFPTPQQVIAVGDALGERIGSGYRTAYLLELAQRIASGELNVEAWRTLSSDELYKSVIGLQGFGEYATGTVLRLLGHCDRLAIDSVARKAFERITGKEKASDAEIRAYYAPFGEWQGLVLWMDCIREDYEADPIA